MRHFWICWSTDLRDAVPWKKSLMKSSSTPPENLTPQQRSVPEINKLTVGDIAASLQTGISDYLARPFMSGFLA